MSDQPIRAGHQAACRLLPDHNAVGSPSKTIHFLHGYLVNLVINLSQRKNNTFLSKATQQHC